MPFPFHRARLTLALACGLTSLPALAAGNPPWVGTWGVAPVPMGPVNYGGKTLREIVHTSVAGTRVRLRFSNAFGDAPLVISDVHLALNPSGSTVDGATDRVATFGGQHSVTIPVGRTAATDAVDMPIPASGDVAVSFYVPEATNVVTGHSYSNQSKWVANGDVSGQPELQASEEGDYQFLLNMDVQGDGLQGTLVALGASATDGFASTYGANHRYPNVLASRLNAAGMKVGIINEGISGNGLINGGPNVLDRFARDVFDQPGVRWVIFSDAPMNDILPVAANATADDMIAAYRTLIAEAHARDIKFYCTTMPTFHAAANWSAEGQKRADALNAFMLSPDSGCDGVVDLHKVLEDPNRPTYTLPAYVASDNLHPSDAGYQAFANAINLADFPPVSLAPVALPASCGAIEPGEGLRPGESLRSCDGAHALTLRTDGNLVVTSGTTTLIDTGTAGSDAAEAYLTPDGNFELRGAVGELLWASGSGGQTGAHMYLQQDGNLVIYAPQGPVWATNTAGR
ncbi:GDSL-type esterase/lipase family protein [Luteibacter aegosomatissinici]|uniref:GDSL-type esterase/lipase family protein n=1 Tax=Luteibacter aegosomatissinici TaxID=2911539 RepID=UPI001FF7291A|nr:GDSL-type esterase/lipase family protein [Luteibacter aegosomatissinici]UPG92739.1 GDSL-type esterase/lipase family protein [Luteibacter aegosomatissinici]